MRESLKLKIKNQIFESYEEILYSRGIILKKQENESVGEEILSPIPEDDELEAYKLENPATGYLRVQTLTARRAYPVKDSYVMVTKNLDSGKSQVFSVNTTDESGLTPVIELPAKDKEESETPDSSVPYAVYTIIVDHEGFLPMIFHNVPVFEGVVSMQTADLIPISAAEPGQSIIDVYEGL